MFFTALLAFFAGTLLAFCAPASATIVVFGHYQGLSGQQSAQPGAEIPVFSVRLVNDGTSALQAIELTLSDLSTPTGISANAFSQLRLYRSTDDIFDAGSDSLVGSQSTVLLDQVSSIPLDEPLSWDSSFPYFIATVTLNTSHSDELGTNKDAFRVGTASDAIRTSNGNIGSDIIADNANSVSIDVVATQIAFETEPADPSADNGDVNSGRTFATQPILAARDVYGNVDVEASGTATLSVGSGSVTLSGTATAGWTSGRAAFTDLAISTNSDGASFTLSATSAGLTGTQSSALVADIVATRMLFSTQPAHSGVANGDILSGVVFQVQPIVQAQDDDGKVDVHFTDTVTLTTDGPGPLSGTTTQGAVSGVATFTDIAYTATADGQNITLIADDQPSGSGGNLPTVSTANLTADIIATQIVFTTLPSDPAASNGDVVSGKPFTTQPVLEARSSSGQRDINFAGSVTLSLPPGNPTLSGTTSKTWVGGRADFVGNGLQVTATSDATPFALSATSGALSGQSTTLTADVIATIMVAISTPADGRAYNGDIVSGVAFQTQPMLEAQDANGILDSHYAGTAPTIALQSGDVQLSGTQTASWSDGRATWSDVSITASSEGQIFALSFTNGGDFPAIADTSTADIVATQLVFTALPTDAGATNGDVVSGTAFETQPVLQAQDADGQIDTHFADTVTLTTDAGGTLSGTTSLQATGGVAAFTDVTYTATEDGQSFALVAADQAGGSGGDLPDANSGDRIADIVATRIAFATLPAHSGVANGDVLSGIAFETQPVLHALDSDGTIDADFSDTVQLTTSDLGSLTGTTARQAADGIVTFTDVAYAATADRQSFTIIADDETGGSEGDLPEVSSGPYIADIMATRLVFADSPLTLSLAQGELIDGQLGVQAIHEDGAIDNEFAGSITLDAVAPDQSVPLLGFTAQPGLRLDASSGQVNFTSAIYSEAGQIQLWATSPGLIPARSATLSLTGWLTLRNPTQQVDNQLAFQRDGTPKNVSLLTFSVEAEREPIGLQDLAVSLELGNGMSTTHIDTLYLWQDSGTLGSADVGDRLIGVAQVDSDGQAAFASLSDTLVDPTNLLITWSARSPLQAGWSLRGRLNTQAIAAQSTQITGASVPVLGEEVEGIWHEVGAVGQPHRLLLQAAPDTLVADSLSSTVLSATVVDAQLRPISTENRTLVGFTMLSGAAWIEGPVSAQAQNGVASTQLRAGTTPGPVRVAASAAGLRSDTVEVALIAGAPSSLTLVADPPSILLDDGDQTELTVWVRDAYGNLTGDGESITSSITGPGSFLNGIDEARSEGGIGTLQIVASEPGTLRVAAAVGTLDKTLEIPVIATQPPYVTLTSSTTEIPASGEQSAVITAYLLDSRGQLISSDSSTRVRFTLLEGQADLSQDEAIANNGIVSTVVRSLGLAGPIVLRAEAVSFQEATISVTSRAADPYRVDVIVEPSQIVADRQSTSTLSAVVRDSLGNIVTDTDVSISFFITEGNAELIGPQTAQTSAGTAQTTLRSSIYAEPVLLRAEASGLLSGTGQIELVAGPAAKVSLQAFPQALSTSDTIGSELIAEIQDVHGNRIVSDSTTIVSFSISGGPGTILPPRFARADSGRVLGRVQPTGPQGNVLVFAGASGLSPSTFEIPVRQAQPPRFTSDTFELEIVEDGSPVYLALGALVEDIDSTPEDLTFSLESQVNSVALSIDDQQLVAAPALADYFGTVQTTLIVRDPTGLEDSAQLQIDVLPQNDPPFITSVPDTLATVDSLYFYALSGLDPDGDPIRFSLLEGPQDMQFDSAIGKAAWRPSQPGSYDVRIAATDGRIASEQSFRIHVLSSLERISFSSEPVTRAYIGRPYSYLPQLINVQVRDASFSLLNAPERMSINPNTGQISWLPISGDPVNSDVTLRASDGIQQVFQRFEITLATGNEAPRIVSTPPLTARVDSVYLYAVQADDPDADPLVYTIMRGPETMRINPLNGLVSWVPQRGDIGSYEIAISAYDGQLNDEQIFQLTVTPLDGSPLIDPIRGITVEEGVATLDLTRIVSDADHPFDSLSWDIQTIGGDPVDIAYTAGDSSVSFYAPAEFTQAQVGLIVSDPEGNTDEHTLHVEPRQASDFNGDTDIDLGDFFTLADAFGASPDEGRWNDKADLNSDGRIDFDDFFAFVDSFNQANTPPK
ncbi:MAG: invasin domain 3-containing protein [Candidatus Latescibacterota bacterium]